MQSFFLKVLNTQNMKLLTHILSSTYFFDSLWQIFFTFCTPYCTSKVSGVIFWQQNMPINIIFQILVIMNQLDIIQLKKFHISEFRLNSVLMWKPVRKCICLRGTSSVDSYLNATLEDVYSFIKLFFLI